MTRAWRPASSVPCSTKRLWGALGGASLPAPDWLAPSSWQATLHGVNLCPVNFHNFFKAYGFSPCASHEANSSWPASSSASQTWLACCEVLEQHELYWSVGGLIWLLADMMDPATMLQMNSIFFSPMASYSCTNKAKCKKALVRCIMLHHSWIVATQVHHPFTLSSSSVSNKWTKQRVMFSTSCIPKWWNPCFGLPSLSSNRSLASLSFKPKARQLCILNLPDAPTISCFWRNKCLQYKQSVDILNYSSIWFIISLIIIIKSTYQLSVRRVVREGTLTNDQLNLNVYAQNAGT